MIRKVIADEIKSREITKNVNCDRSIRSVYVAHPDLASIDERIVRLRKIDLLNELEETEGQDHTEQIKALKKERSEYLKNNGIPLDFDSQRVICSVCNDTGYVSIKGKETVCSCMKGVLEECYTKCGLADFETVKPSAFDLSYFGEEHKDKRRIVQKELARIISHLTDNRRSGDGILVYSDMAGRGKTFVAVCFCKLAMMYGLDSYYLKCGDFAGTYDDKLQRLKKADLLFIDDFSSELTLRNNIAYAFSSVLEYREVQGLATVIVSREIKQEMLDNSEERISSKLKRGRFI